MYCAQVPVSLNCRALFNRGSPVWSTLTVGRQVALAACLSLWLGQLTRLSHLYVVFNLSLVYESGRILDCAVSLLTLQKLKLLSKV